MKRYGEATESKRYVEGYLRDSLQNNLLVSGTFQRSDCYKRWHRFTECITSNLLLKVLSAASDDKFKIILFER